MSQVFDGVSSLEYSQYIPFLTAEKWHTICGILPPALRADFLIVCSWSCQWYVRSWPDSKTIQECVKTEPTSSTGESGVRSPVDGL